MTFDEMWEELKSESPEARAFYEDCERQAAELNKKAAMRNESDRIYPLKEGEQSCCKLCKHCGILHKRGSSVAQMNRVWDETRLCCCFDPMDIYEMDPDEFCDYFKRVAYGDERQWTN